MTSLYVIRESGTTHVKIGIADDVGRRRNELQIGNPRTLRLLFDAGFESRSEALEAERHFKWNYRPERIRTNGQLSEWYDATPRIIAELWRIKAGGEIVRELTPAESCGGWTAV